MLADSIIEIIASSLAAGLSIEASSYPKPGNVSPLGGTKDLEHWFFIAASTSISIEIFKIIQKVIMSKGCPEEGVGESIYKIYSASSKPHGGKNVHLGFTMLLVPIAMGFGDLIRSGHLDGVDVEEVLNRSVDLVRECGDPKDSLWISRAILEASPSYIFKYQGHGYDLLSRLEGGKSFWEFVEDFKRHDLILNEIWNRYQRTHEAYNMICSNYPDNLYGGVVTAFIAIGSEAIDTLIARKRGYRVAIKVRAEMKKILSLLRQGTPLWRLYAELLDRELKISGINPGSIADIIALASGLCVAIRAIERHKNSSQL